jgi:hypothetical protein
MKEGRVRNKEKKEKRIECDCENYKSKGKKVELIDR